jgi:hypothetical protein
MEERAALTVGVAFGTYAIALWLLAPDIVKRAIALARGLISRAVGPRRRVALQAR